ncbi:ABC transporter permease/substrate-binding protein [bacterium]|nr:ABC transporter permease/substrate-binding protein [bacterium]
MSANLAEQLALLPERLGSHLQLVLASLAIGIAISLPLAVAATRIRALQGPLLAVVSVIQTIPGLALLALMVPLLGMIGFVPALIALILYSMLPVVRNTVTGIEGVDASMVEAARGIGMTPGQVLLRVQLPLAAPVIIAGVRTATVWVVGIATLSTPVGATSLGNFIFSGLQTQNHVAVLVGCGAAAMLAIVLDLLIRLLELAASRRSAGIAALAGAGLLVVLAGGMWPLLAAGGAGGERPRALIGAKTFTEQYILAELIAGQLEQAGFAAKSLESLGSTVVFDALAAGKIDCYVDYSGTIWANHMKRDDNPGAALVLQEMTAWLKETHGIHCLGALGFENAYALAMRGADAERLGIVSIADLARHSASMKIGGDYEFFSRPEWKALEDAYQLEFSREISFDPTLMYAAVAQGDVDVISAFSTDGRIAAFDLAVLADPRVALPPYDAVLLLSRDAAANQALVDALRPLVGAIDDAAMRNANMMVDVDGKAIGEAAEYLRAGW